MQCFLVLVARYTSTEESSQEEGRQGAIPGLLYHPILSWFEQKYSIIALAVFLILVACGQKESQAVIQNKKINANWQFYLGDVPNGESINLKNASEWRTVNLPHDWSIEGQYSQKNGADWQTGFLPTGIGWYRKTLNWDEAWEGKKVYIHFEGVYVNSDIYLNGKHLKHEHHGYLGFEIDLTEHLTKGENLLAVRIDHTNFKTGRWYTGSGIYRNVWLKVKSQLHIQNWGVAFQSKQHDKQSSAYTVEVFIENHLAESKEGMINASLFDADDQEVASLASPFKVNSGTSVIKTLEGNLENVQKWSPDSPYLYQLVVSLTQNGSVVDKSVQKVGFRDIEFKLRKGMFINGAPTKIKGVCEHHTAGAFGAAVPDDVWLNRLVLLKEMGANGIRTAHNPFSPTFYDLCDSLGFLVLNEFTDGWEREKATYDYGLYFEEHWESDLTRFVKRDRNHPSVIMWSIGNEVKRPTLETQRKLINTIRKYDPLRKITQGGRDPSRDMDGDEIPTLLGIKGFNGHGEIPGVFEHHHEEFPDEILLGTEVPHTYATRGVYRTKTHWRVRDFPAMWERKRNGDMSYLEGKKSEIPDFTEEEVFTDEITTQYYQNGEYKPIEVDHQWGGQLFYQSSYDNATARIGVRQMWQRIDSLPYVIGQYRWTGFDYLGETNNWPSRFANFGVIDIAGFPKDPYYLYQSLWSDEPMVHILPHWTHPSKEGVEIPVVVYTNCEEVELFLNGKSLGKKSYQGEQLVWLVPYESGTLEAKAFHKGGVIHAKHQTSGAPHHIRLTPNRKSLKANQTDILEVMAEIVDENGVLCPKADLPLTFEVNGNATIVGVDNGDPLDLSDYQSNQRKTFRGKAKIWLQVGGDLGEIKIAASTGDLKNGEAFIKIIQ